MHRSQNVKGMPAANRASHTFPWADHGLRLLCSECFHCRECHALISPFAKVCSRCGASSPVVISIKPFVLPVGICVAALILWILFLSQPGSSGQQAGGS
jgi:hypothetical protein